MKTLVKLFVFILSITFSNAQETTGSSITVSIDNALNNKGSIVFGLHTSSTFMKAAALQTTESKIVDGKSTITFKNVQPGMYAIMVLHDENENKQMDFEPNGMPKENYGMSNNPVNYGPPTFDSAKFEVTNKDIILKIRF